MLQLALQHRAGVHQFSVLEQPDPGFMVEDIRPEAPSVQIHAALDGFHWGVWARHFRPVTLHFMSERVKSDVRGDQYGGFIASLQPLRCSSLALSLATHAACLSRYSSRKVMRV